MLQFDKLKITCVTRTCAPPYLVVVVILGKIRPSVETVASFSVVLVANTKVNIFWRFLITPITTRQL